MAKIGFFNDNANRAYPFVQGTVNARPPAFPPAVEDISNGIVVDAGFLMGLRSDFDAEGHEVFLHEIRRAGGTFFLEFRSDSPGLFEEPLIFTREVGDPDFEIEFTDNTNVPSTSLSFSPPGSGGDCEAEPLWSGFLVTGKISVLEDLLPGDGTVVRAGDGGLIEPALIRSLDESYVDSLNIANADRTRVSEAESCPPVVWPHPTEIIFVRDTCIRGDVRLKPGFNAVIQQDVFDNALEIGAVANAGEGQVCEQVPLFEGESPPEGGDSSLLEGGLRCDEVVRSINGVGGEFLNFLAGLGATITPDPDNNKLIVDLDMAGLALCFVSDVSEQSESL